MAVAQPSLISLAFWNAHAKQGLEPMLARLAFEVLARAAGAPAVIGLTESQAIHDQTIQQMMPGWSVLRPLNAKFLLLQSPGINVNILSQPQHGLAFSVPLARGQLSDWIFWVVHLPAPINENPDVLSVVNASMLRAEIDSLELQFATTKTAVIGDFNMDPYSHGMTSPTSLNAVMCKKIASRRTRRVDKRNHQFFYNPMWSVLGDQTLKNQPGSYYRPSAKTNAAFWHAIDQVLVRPSVLGVSDLTVNFVTQIGGDSLLGARSGLSNLFSDHLPIEANFRNKI